MPRKQLTFDVLLSCASEMKADMIVVEDEITQVTALLRSRAVALNSLHWERDAMPMRAESPQAAINDQLLNRADVICALVGTKVGQPTTDYHSGTFEEIIRFVRERTKPAGDRSVQIYFKRENVDPFEVDFKHIEMIKELKVNLSDFGVLYKEFRDESELRPLVRKALMEFVEAHLAAHAAELEAPISVSKADEPGEDGFLDYIERSSKAGDEFAEACQRLALTIQGTGARFEAAAELVNSTKGIGLDVRALTDELAQVMEEAAKSVGECLPTMRVAFSSVIESTMSALDVAADGGLTSQSDVDHLLSEVAASEQAARVSQRQIVEFRNSVSTMPNYSKRLRSAGRRLVSSLIEVDELFDLFVGRFVRLRENYST